MCGLVGMAGALESKDEEVFQRLLVTDYFRGKDSTGMAAVRRNDEVHIAKLHSHPWDLFDTGRFKTALSGYNSKAFIGHNRARTSGTVNSVNAHPFMFDHIVGAHNGTLPFMMHRKLEKIVGEDYPVDSMALLASIAKIGVKKTIEQIQGSWALVWYDLQNDSINFLRNSARPLFFAWSEDFKRIYWASEWRMMEFAINSGGQKMWKRPTDNIGFFEFPADQHYCLPISRLMEGGKTPPKFKAKEVKESPNSDTNSYLGLGYHRGTNSPGVDPFGREPWQDDWDNYIDNKEDKRGNVVPFMPGQAGGHSKNSNGKTGANSSGRSSPNVIFLSGSEEDPFAGRLTKQAFENIASAGCQWCGKKVEYTDPGIAVYCNDEIVLCSEHSPSANGGNRLYVTGAL